MVDRLTSMMVIALLCMSIVYAQQTTKEQEQLQTLYEIMKFPTEVTLSDVAVVSKDVVEIKTLNQIDVKGIPGPVVLKVPNGAKLKDINGNEYTIGAKAGSVVVVKGQVQLKDANLENSKINGQVVSGKVALFDSATNEMTVKGSIIINGIKYASSQNQKFSVWLAKDSVTVAGRDVLLTNVNTKQVIGKLNGKAMLYPDGRVYLMKSDVWTKSYMKPGKSREIEYTTYGSYTEYRNNKPSVTYEVSQDTWVLKTEHCAGEQNCVRRVGGEIRVTSMKSNTIVITALDTTVKTLWVNQITDSSRVVYNDYKKVQMIFTREPILVRGDWGKISVDVYSTYLNKQGQSHELNIIKGKVERCSYPCIDFCVGTLMDERIRTLLTTTEGTALINDLKKYSPWASLDVVKDLLPNGDPRLAKAVLRSYLMQSSNTGFVKKLEQKYPPIGMTPEQIYGSIYREGMDQWIKYGGLDHPVISSYSVLGSDYLLDDLKKIEENGNLAPGYLVEKRDYFIEIVKRQETLSEKNNPTQIRTATFTDFQKAIDAAGAMMAYRSGLFLRDATNLGIDTKKISADEISFWNYVYYNSGQGNGKKMLTAYKAQGFLRNNDYVWQKPSESWSKPWANANKVAGTVKVLRESGVLPRV